MSAPAITRLEPGVYRVELDGLAHIVHVAGSGADTWMHCDGEVYHRPFEEAAAARRTRAGAQGPQSLAAPMPATVLKVLVGVGAAVRSGDTLLILEAMKMELPLKAAGDGVVRQVHCHEGQLVQPDTVLVELE